METFWRYFFIVFGIHCVASFSLREIVDGTVPKSWNIEIVMRVDDDVGVIVSCFDSTRNQFTLDSSLSDDNYGRIISVNYNTLAKDFRLGELCGCNPCDDAIAVISIEFSRGQIEVVCNFRRPTLVLQVEDNNIIINEEGKNETLPQFNDDDPKPQRNTCTADPWTDIAPLCPKKCRDNICNNGRCTEVLFGVECDCSSVALNGAYCNRELRMYSPGRHNSYTTTMMWYHQMNLKMTWRQSMSERMYCLMEIIGRYDHVTIWTNNTELMMNSAVIGRMNISKNNFVMIIVTENSLRVKVNNYEKRITEFTMDNDVRVNIGFTEDIFLCVTFHGTYDIHFPMDQLRKTRDVPTMTEFSTFTRTKVIPIISIVGVIIIVLIVCAIGKIQKGDRDTTIITKEAINEVRVGDDLHLLDEDDRRYHSIRDSTPMNEDPVFE